MNFLFTITYSFTQYTTLSRIPASGPNCIGRRNDRLVLPVGIGTPASSATAAANAPAVSSRADPCPAFCPGVNPRSLCVFKSICRIASASSALTPPGPILRLYPPPSGISTSPARRRLGYFHVCSIRVSHPRYLRFSCPLASSQALQRVPLHLPHHLCPLQAVCPSDPLPPEPARIMHSPLAHQYHLHLLRPSERTSGFLARRPFHRHPGRCRSLGCSHRTIS